MMTKAENAMTKGWHVDKTISLSLIFAAAVQTAAFIWFFSALSSHVTELDHQAVKQEGRLNVLEEANKNLAITTAGINAQLSGIHDALEVIRSGQRDTNDLVRQMLEKK